MKFRYFLLKGESLRAYLESEDREMTQRENIKKVLLKDRDDIESYWLTHQGKILAIKFKPGMTPDGFINVKGMTPDAVKPHGKRTDTKEWRDLLDSLSITEDCQDFIRRRMDLPVWVQGEACGFGSKIYSSAVGHVGDHVYVEVPVNDETPYSPHADLEEVKGWEFEKTVEECELEKSKETAGEGRTIRGYTMSSRLNK